MRKRTILLAVMAALAGTVYGGGPALADMSDNVTVAGRHGYVGGTEIGFAGGYVYAGQYSGHVFRNEPGFGNQGGFHVIDVAGGGFDVVGSLHCPGTDNDVKAVRPGLVVVAHHSSRCNPIAPFGVSDGIFLADVSDPTNPVPIGGVRVASAHTVTVHPSGDYVYVSPGGLANAAGVLSIVDVRDPTKPKVAGTFTPNRIGCHDLGFHPTEPLAYCAGLGETQVWDITNPAAPQTVHHIVNPAIQFAHNAIVSPDGRWLVINDEAFVAHECETSTSLYGSLWIYDLTDPRLPIVAGRIAPPASRSTVGEYTGWTASWCTSHNYNFIDGNRLVASWYTGGTRVYDIADPLVPVEMAHYMPDDAIAYTAHWYEGRVYVNDLNRGLEALEIDLPEVSPAREAAFASRPKIDMTPLLLPTVLPPRAEPAERSLTQSLICVVPKAA